MAKYVLVRGTLDDLMTKVNLLINGPAAADTSKEDIAKNDAWINAGFATAEVKGDTRKVTIKEEYNATFTVVGGLSKVNDSIFIQSLTD